VDLAQQFHLWLITLVLVVIKIDSRVKSFFWKVDLMEMFLVADINDDTILTRTE